MAGGSGVKASFSFGGKVGGATISPTKPATTRCGRTHAADLARHHTYLARPCWTGRPAVCMPRPYLKCTSCRLAAATKAAAGVNAAHAASFFSADENRAFARSSVAQSLAAGRPGFGECCLVGYAVCTALRFECTLPDRAAISPVSPQVPSRAATSSSRQTAQGLSRCGFFSARAQAEEGSRCRGERARTSSSTLAAASPPLYSPARMATSSSHWMCRRWLGLLL